MRAAEKHAVLATLLLTLLASGCGDRTVDNRQQAPPSAPGPADAVQAGAERPNFLVILADDLGYTDIGAYGSEISTPNLDSLANNGVTFSQFYASPMCSPSRAMLLTGMDYHRVGLGNLAERLADNQRGRPGYEGRLNSSAITLPELLKHAGYRNYMAGKWHLGATDGADPGSRGFDHSFALHDSGAGHFANMLPLVGPGKIEYREDGVLVEELPADFYSTRFYTDKMLEYLESGLGDDRPFFAYLAFTATHFPLQAPPDSIRKHHGKYDAGYDVLQEERLRRAKALGLVAENATAFPGTGIDKPWKELTAEEQTESARRMEIYAAMIDNMDDNVGRVLSFLRNEGLAENTFVIFLSDNGAEGHWLDQGLEPVRKWAAECCDNSVENMGNAASYVMLGASWARASMTPFRMFKGFTSEGGVRVPAIFSFPQEFAGGKVSASIASIKDVMPTILQLAGAGDTPMLTLDGESMLPLLRGDRQTIHGDDDYIAWELFGKRAVRQQQWKAVRESRFVNWWDSSELGIKPDTWQLYNLGDDPAELTDMAARHPDQLQHMIELWENYAKTNGVVLPDTARGY